MRNIYQAALLFCCITLLSDLYAAEPLNNNLVFHFNFKDAAGKREIRDTTGVFRCISKNHDFAVQKKSLRVAPCVQIYIPSENLPDLSKELTLSAWILKRSTPDVTPILMKGEHPAPIDFLFSLGWRYPAFCYKNELGQKYWKGLYYNGTFGSSINYPQKEWLVSGGELVESSGYWKNLTTVFNKGNIKIYVNGKLTSELRSNKEEYLKITNAPIWVGSEQIKGEAINYHTADMLLNDIRLFNKAMSAKQVKQLFNADSKNYPLGNLIPSGETHLNALSECRQYPVDKEYDPDFKRKLKVTEKYEKSIPLQTSKKNIKVEIRKTYGHTGLFIDGLQQYPIAVKPAPKNFATGKYWFDKMNACIRDFAAADVNFIGAVLFPDFFYTGKEGQYNFAKIDNMMRNIIKANPKAKILVYFMVVPPPWFYKKYPNEIEQTYFGSRLAPQKSGPLGSDVWFDVSTNMLRDIVGHIESSDYASHVYAYLPGGGQSAEWYWPGSVYGGITGYSKATEKTFRSWLRQQYNDDNVSLQKAWNNKDVTFETAKVPSPEARNKTDYYLFRNPAVSKPVYDFRRYMTDYTVKHITGCGKAIKEASNFQKIVTVYSGYTLPSTAKKLYNSGLLGTGQIFRSAYIDCLVTPISYGSRRGGQPGLSVTPFNGTSYLYGKLLWQEEDLRTHFCPKIANGRTANLKESLAVIKRGLAHSITKNTGFWWLLFDNAWMHQECMMQAVLTIKKAADKALKKQRRSASEVAIIFDENSLFHLAYTKNPFLRNHSWDVYENASRMGAPFDFYLLDDIRNNGMPDYKLYIFLNAFYVDTATREAISRKVRRNNAVSVWCYAPGFITSTGFNTEAMRHLTGINLEEIKGEVQSTLKIINTNSPITKFGYHAKPFTIGPSFYVKDPKAQILGTVNGKPALAVKEFSCWKAVYSLMPLTKELLMGLCDYAGVHIYSRSFDIIGANQDYMMLHTSTSGKKTICLPTSCNVKDILSGKVVGNGISCFTEDIPAQETRIYQLDKSDR